MIMHVTKNETNANSVQNVNYIYENNVINFKVNGSVLISATNMAKPFEKRPVDWLRLPSTKDFLIELGKVRKSNFAQFIVTKKGGVNPGTWFHEDVALEFARWLSPAFAIWCNDRIKEILLQRMGAAPVLPTVSPRVLDCPPEDKELLKWKNSFNSAMDVVKKMHESNVLVRQTMDLHQSTLNNFVHSYICPDNRVTYVPPKLFDLIENLGSLIQSQQKTIDFLQERL